MIHTATSHVTNLVKNIFSINVGYQSSCSLVQFQGLSDHLPLLLGEYHPRSDPRHKVGNQAKAVNLCARGGAIRCGPLSFPLNLILESCEKLGSEGFDLQGLVRPA